MYAPQVPIAPFFIDAAADEAPAFDTAPVADFDGFAADLAAGFGLLDRAFGAIIDRVEVEPLGDS